MAIAPAAWGAPRVWAVGDGGVAGPADDRLAARVAREGIDRLLYLGDVYETGTATDYAENYAPSWGRFKGITSPTPGNHEWDNRAEGYDRYWGSLAPRNRGGHYYSFNIGGWHFVSLNSHEHSGPGSAQAAWLRRDLKRIPGHLHDRVRPSPALQRRGARGLARPGAALPAAVRAVGCASKRPRPQLPAPAPAAGHHAVRGRQWGAWARVSSTAPIPGWRPSTTATTERCAWCCAAAV